MIKNERQYRATVNAVEQFKQELARRPESPPPESDIHPRVWRAELDVINGELGRLEQEIIQYDELKSGARNVHPIRSWADVPHALIEARIAANLTHRELAARLGMAEQQVQRYEATDYASASLSRIRETAAVLDVELTGVVMPLEATLSADKLLDRIAELQLNRRWLLNRVLPNHLLGSLKPSRKKSTQADTSALVQIADVVSRVFEVPLTALLGSTPLSPAFPHAATARFKRSRRAGGPSTGSVAAQSYVAYARFVAEKVAEACAHLPIRRLPGEPAEWIAQMSSAKQPVGLESALHFIWDHGIPVVPLTDAGHFFAACWRLQSRREVIVIKQVSRSSDRWLSDLIHEGAHLVYESGDAPFSMVEKNDNPSVTDEREAAATQFSADVVLRGKAELLAEQALEEADGNIPYLKRIVPSVARRAGVATGVLAYYVAYFVARETNGRANWWGTAQSLQETSGNPWRIARDILIERMDFSVLSNTDRDIVLRALSDDAPVGSSSIDS